MKRFFLKLAIIAVLLAFPIYNLIASAAKRDVTSSIGTTDISVISGLSSGSVADVEHKIEKLDEQKRERLEQQMLQAQRKKNEQILLDQIASGKTSYRQLFKSSLIVGDSLMNGLEVYSILDSGNMITKVSASLYHLSDNVKTIINNNPKILILHYGINMIESDDDHLNWFIDMYSGLIKQIQKGLPKTRIVISSIFTVSKDTVAHTPRFGRTAAYNARLEKMCNDLSIEYLDNGSLLPANDKYYVADGIHVIKDFYTDVWLPHTVLELGL